MNKYDVCQFYANGMYDYVQRYVAPKIAVEVALRLIKSVSAQSGMIRRIIITDSEDCINFEWTFENGIVFPSAENLKNRRDTRTSRR